MLEPEYAVMTRVGQREINQDYCALYQGQDLWACLVADGCGSYEGSEELSKHLCDLIVNTLKSNELSLLHQTKSKLISLIRGCVEETFNEVKDTPAYHSATTLSLLVIANHKYWIFHVGDTRIYRINLKNKAVWHTRDDTQLQQLVEEGALDKKKDKFHESSNLLLNAIDKSLNYSIHAKIGRYIDSHIAFGLFSDGIWPYLSNQEMVSLFKEDDLHKALGRTLDSIQENGNDQDNMTGILIRFL